MGYTVSYQTALTRAWDTKITSFLQNTATTCVYRFGHTTDTELQSMCMRMTAAHGPARAVGSAAAPRLHRIVLWRERQL